MKFTLTTWLPVRVDWLIFVCVMFVWLVIFLLFKNLGSTSRRRRSREIAEKAVRAGDPYRRAERVPVDAGTVESLPQEQLQRLTDEFVRLGFGHVLDYRVRLPGGTNLIGFGRAFVNRELLCFGEIMATQKALETGGPLLFGLDSYLENEWRLGAINRGPFVTDYLQRLPKNPRLMIPDARPAELLKLHLDQRTNLERDLKLKVLTDLSLETRFRRTYEMMALRREVLLTRDILAELPEARRQQAAGRWEWLGDYPDEMARRKKGPVLRPLKELSPTYSVPQDDALERIKKADEGEATEKSGE